MARRSINNIFVIGDKQYVWGVELQQFKYYRKKYIFFFVNYIFIGCKLTNILTFPILYPKKMSQQYNKLPNYIQKLIPQPNYDNTNLHNLTNQNPIKIINSIKTKTVLDLLKCVQISDPQPVITLRPIILVFCQPSQQIVIEKDKIFPYTPVSYVNWLEGVGARCVPLPFNTNEGSIQYLLERSHGLLIPGGGSNLYKNFDLKQGQGPVMIGFLKIWRFIQKLWAKGVHYPIWGTCLGLQIILLAISGDTKILSKLNSRGHQTEIYSNYQSSFILKKMPIKLRLKSQNYKLLNFQHTYGISIKKYLSSPKLIQKLKITQISKDKDNKWFCSGLQGRNIPVYISQYHPEKQAYQWSKTGEIKHNRDTIQLSQYLAEAFLTQCRKCKSPKQFGSPAQQLFFSFQKYRQIHTPQKLYKVYAIDFKYRDNDKQARKQIRSQRSVSITTKIRPIL